MSNSLESKLACLQQAKKDLFQLSTLIDMVDFDGDQFAVPDKENEAINVNFNNRTRVQHCCPDVSINTRCSVLYLEAQFVRYYKDKEEETDLHFALVVDICTHEQSTINRELFHAPPLIKTAYFRGKTLEGVKKEAHEFVQAFHPVLQDSILAIHELLNEDKKELSANLQAQLLTCNLIQQ